MGPDPVLKEQIAFRERNGHGDRLKPPGSVRAVIEAYVGWTTLTRPKPSQVPLLEP